MAPHQLLEPVTHTPAPQGATEAVVGGKGAVPEAEAERGAGAVAHESAHNPAADATTLVPTSSLPSGHFSQAPGAAHSNTTVPTSTVATDLHSLISTPAPASSHGAPADTLSQQHNGSTRRSPAPAAAAMSNPPQHPGHPRPPVGFPSPTYSSPGMNAHYGYANAPGQPGDLYRGSPSTPGGSNHPMSLPSMRTFDPVQQQQAQQVPMAQQMMQVQASMGTGMPYYGQPVPMAGNPYSLPPDVMGPRYALPPNDPRAMMGNPRNKKPQSLAAREVKFLAARSTAACGSRSFEARPRKPRYSPPSSAASDARAQGTGAPGHLEPPHGLHLLCDEQHPICKNCQKSKRECLGYDPIFKQQQQQHHPASIQPAPNHPAPASVPSNGPAPPPPPPPHPPPHPHPHPPAASASAIANSSAPAYASLPSVLPNSYHSGTSSSSNTPGHSYEPARSTSQNIKSENFDYGSAIDPALDSVGAPPSTSTPHLPPARKPVAPIPSSPLGQRLSNHTPSLRGGGPLLVSHLHHPVSHHAQCLHQDTSAYFGSPVKKMRVSELVSWGRSPPPKAALPLSQGTYDEIRSLYADIYGPGLESFFESRWFTEEFASDMVVSTEAVAELLAGFLSIVGKTDQNDNSAMADSANLEFRVVWDLTCLVYSTIQPRVNQPSVIPPDNDGPEVRNRVAMFDALLSGDSPKENSLVRPPPQGDYHRLRELDFWYHLGEFLLVQPPAGQAPTPDMVTRRDAILSRMRTLLDGRENRDVLYSIAVMRALSPGFPPDFESSLPPHLDETDPKSKLAVARKFIQEEAKVTGGTTNIVRRFSELASMAFIHPGTNVTRTS
ncbi:uncharacterized protein JN550_006654 [Neoarthrinium moseri]|uniref:uncharacterized protein n=1 Tax=Neoarthrinium moseri TaxID=1658444 RepID=UPI001FDAF27F|nr:uncharacterized protein JN550_006654 [Neoarthrinium moseri]KAI1867847.1 hypothetical protein JN550_006654 [Neoarthrinium moseri]